jgi:hypothetical protein
MATRYSQAAMKDVQAENKHRAIRIEDPVAIDRAEITRKIRGAAAM